MKASFDKNGSAGGLLTLTPETDQDQTDLLAFAERTRSAAMINCRGFQYLNPTVEFLIQPMPRGD